MQVAGLLALLRAQVLWPLHGAGGRAGHHATMFLVEHLWPDLGTMVPAGGGDGL